jgi:sugar phosphate isomerase/epimerase
MVVRQDPGKTLPLSRRQFVRSVAGAALGTRVVTLRGGTAQAAPQRPDRWAMRLSTSSIHYLHLPIEKACAEIAKLDFEAIDIWSAHVGCPHLDDVAKRLGPDGLKRVLNANQLKLFAFSVYRGGYARYAKLLGQVGGGVAVRGSSGPCTSAELTQRMRKFLAGLQPEIELAQQYDSYLAIENHGNALLNSLDSFKAFVDLNRSPRLGIALAPYHVQRGGESVVEAIRITGRQLRFFYAWQQGSGVAQLPGHGPTDFVPWIAALAQVAYRGYVNPFMHGDLAPDAMSAALARSRDYLQQCYAKALES